MRSTRPPQIYLPGLFLLAGLLAFSLNLNSYFLSDDFVQIGKVLHGDFSVAWGQEHGGFFRPLFIFSYVIDSRLWGARPLGFHLTNVILHGLNGFLVFRLAARMLSSVAPAGLMRNVAIFAAALFLVHPSHSEAVVWISGRADLLATCFVLASLLFYLAYEDKTRRLYLFASIGCFVLALLAKESAVCLPFLILVAGRNLSRRRNIRHLLLVTSSYIVILFAFVIIRAWFIGGIVGGYGTAQHLNFAPEWIRDRLLEAIVRSVVPPLPVSWSMFLFKPLQSPIFYLIAVVAAAGIAVTVLVRRRRYNAAERKLQNRFLWLLAGMFLIALLPVINLRLSLYETLGERFLYLPSVFAALLIAYLTAVLVRNTQGVRLLLLIIISGYAWSLYHTNLRWREAANLSHTISRELADAAPQEMAVMINAPDNLRGVPVFHNGLSEAVAWSRTTRSTAPVQIVAFQDLQGASDEIVISGNGPLYVRALNPADTFSRVNTAPCLEVEKSTSTSLVLNQTPCAPTEIFFLSGSQINRLNNP
jgi:hypothetical protein